MKPILSFGEPGSLGETIDMKIENLWAISNLWGGGAIANTLK